MSAAVLLTVLLTVLAAVLVGAAVLVLSSAPPQAPAVVPRRRRRRARSRGSADGDLALLVDRFATVLHSGVPPAEAWRAVEPAAPASCAELARTGARGGDVAPLLRGHGSAGAAVAAALAVSHTTGAALSPVLRSVATSVREATDADRVQEAAFAGPRATNRILLGLPVAALGIGALLGADPLRMLLSTPLGHACTVAGAALTAVGMVWTRRMIRAAQARAAAAGGLT